MFQLMILSFQLKIKPQYLGHLVLSGQSRHTGFTEANAKAIFRAAREQPFLCKIIKLFYIPPKDNRNFLLPPSLEDDSTRQAIITLSEILSAAFCCYYFSPVFNNHSSPCSLPKSSPAGTQSLPTGRTASRRKALL